MLIHWALEIVLPLSIKNDLDFGIFILWANLKIAPLIRDLDD